MVIAIVIITIIIAAELKLIVMLPDIVGDAVWSRVNVDSKRLVMKWQTTIMTSETVDVV